ncbi:MAG: SUMF1/EgtB/PvdO family nonheme iron enzyme, partial [Rikenellaceae bacterium]|nr:SUMF1/EgtB/PvdO family nonheme iron enzyme [Rikenellaceae bacterium]
GASRHTELAGAVAGTSNSTAGNPAPGTRTTDGGDSWAAGDAVGMFMVSTTGSLPGGILTVGGTTADNRLYNVNPGTGSLTPDDGDKLYYLQSGSVDFIAYYPYTATIGTGPGEITPDYIYNLTVADQTDDAAQNALDVLYAKTIGAVKSKTAVNLQFGHVLSKVTLNLTAGDGIADTDIAAMARTEVEFKGMPVTASLDLNDGWLTAGTDLMQTFSPVKAGTPSSTADATFTALVIPQTGTNTGRTVVFTVAGVAEPLTWTIPDTDAFEAGQHYTYQVTVTRHGITFGNQTITPWTPNDNDDGSGAAEILARRVKAGTFLMGSPQAEPNRWNDETQHQVTLTEDFFMSKYPVTNTEYAAFLNAKKVPGGESIYNPAWGMMDAGICSWGENDGEALVFDGSAVSDWGVNWNGSEWLPASGYENHPAIWVTWYGAYEYAQWLTQTTGMTWRLPTEAEWEYACRATTITAFYFGDDESDLGDYGWHWGNSSDGTKAVGQKIPNGYGLYDMHGNVFEWCSDWYGNYDPAEDTDPVGPVSGDNRVLRGGSWINLAQDCRSAFRNGAYPDFATDLIGFRVVFVP